MITGGGRREEAGQAKPPDQRPGQPAGAVVSATGRAAHYEIRVEGVLDNQWAAWFDGLQVIGEGEETVISGLLADQPALLAKIRDLGLADLRPPGGHRQMAEMGHRREPPRRGIFPGSGKSCNKDNTSGPNAPGYSAECSLFGRPPGLYVAGRQV